MLKRIEHIVRRIPYYVGNPTSIKHYVRLRLTGTGPQRVIVNQLPSPSDHLLLGDCCFLIGGGFGDHLLAARYIRDLSRTVGGLKFDIFSPQPVITEWIFRNIEGFQTCYDDQFSWHLAKERYNFHFVVADYVRCDAVNVQLVKRTTQITKLLGIIQKITRYRQTTPNFDAFLTNHPYMCGFLAQGACASGFKRYNYPHGISGIGYGFDGLPLETAADAITKFKLPAKYITIANGFDDSFHGKTNGVIKSTKSFMGYDKLIAALKARDPNLFIVQVGKGAEKQMAGVDLNLVNQTDSLSALAAVIKNSQLHIDNESGLVHLANCLGVRSCVIFGPTSVEFFGYPENINIAPTFCGNCFWVTKTWMTDCPRGFAEPRCLSQQDVAVIADRVVQGLSAISATGSSTQIDPSAAVGLPIGGLNAHVLDNSSNPQQSDFLGLVKEYQRLAAENLTLSSALKAQPKSYFHPAELTADPPQRYVANLHRYLEGGGKIDLKSDVVDFVKDSANNASDLARFYAFCLMFDQIEKEKIPGDLAEIGVYKGHTGTLLAKFARRTGRHLYLMDTYEGFSEKDLTGIDGTQQMQFKDTSLDFVRAAVGTENVTFVKGHFPGTASQLSDNGTYAVVHVDCDLHDPMRASLEYFYPRVAEGGYLVLHDYASLWWPGAELAVDEFFRDKPECVVLMPDISGTVIVRKLKRPRPTLS